MQRSLQIFCRIFKVTFTVSYLPDLRTLVILHSAYLTGFIRIPRESVHYWLMQKLPYRHVCLPDVQQLYAVTLLTDHRKQIQVIRVPLYLNQGRAAFINDAWLLQILNVKYAHWPVFTTRGKHGVIRRKAHIIDCLVMRDDLRRQALLVYIKDRDCAVNTRDGYLRRIDTVPIEWANWVTEFLLVP